MSTTTDETQSFRAQIEALEVGDTFSRAQRFDGNEVTKDVPLRFLRGVRDAMQPTVFRIQQRTGQTYRIESGEFRTQTRDIIACLAVTRIS